VFFSRPDKESLADAVRVTEDPLVHPPGGLAAMLTTGEVKSSVTVTDFEPVFPSLSLT
jgi:hypothetical protein